MFEDACFRTTSQWKRFVAEVDDEDRGWLERQAYWFAGCALVPLTALKMGFLEAKHNARQHGLEVDENWAVAEEYVCDYLARRFEVSGEVIARQLRYDDLV